MGLLTGLKRERCPSLDSELDEGGLAVAETLFRLSHPSGDSSAGSKGVDESQEEQSSSISTSSSGMGLVAQHRYGHRGTPLGYGGRFPSPLAFVQAQGLLPRQSSFRLQQHVELGVTYGEGPAAG